MSRAEPLPSQGLAKEPSPAEPFGQSCGTTGAAAADSLGAGVGVAALAEAGAAAVAAEAAALALAADPAPFSGSFEQAVKEARDATRERRESVSRFGFDIAHDATGGAQRRSTGQERRLSPLIVVDYTQLRRA